MSAAAEPPLPQPSLDLLEESRIWGWDGSSWTEVSVDSNGQIQTAISDALQSEAADEVRTRVFGPDAGGTLQQVLAEQFDTALATTDVGLATYGDRALRSLNQDELNSVILGVNQAGSLQEVGVEAFNSAAAAGGFALLTYGDRALQTQAADEHRARLFQDDAGGALRQVLAEQLDTAVANTDVGLLTYSGRALQTSGQDELRARMFNTSGTNIDPATTALENALQANAADEYRSRLFGLDAGGVLQHVNAEEFGTALAATDVGIATYGDRALASLAQDEWIARTADSTGAQQDLQQTDSAFGSGVAITAGGTNSTGLSAPGASKLRGRVVNDAQYDVDIEVLDAPGGTVLFTVNVATDVAASTETALDENLESPFINVVITNDGGAQSAATFSYHLVGGN